MATRFIGANQIACAQLTTPNEKVPVTPFDGILEGKYKCPRRAPTNDNDRQRFPDSGVEGVFCHISWDNKQVRRPHVSGFAPPLFLVRNVRPSRRRPAGRNGRGRPPVRRPESYLCRGGAEILAG
jgi:hypothetical protein